MNVSTLVRILVSGMSLKAQQIHPMAKADGLSLRHPVSIATAWHRLKEISCNEFAAFRDLFRLNQILRTFNYGRLLEQNALIVGLAIRSEARRLPCPPPMSTNLRIGEKSYFIEISAFSVAEKLVIASSKIFPDSGF